MNDTEIDLQLGSWVCQDGVGFKVWAPNAESVSVVGDWNDWDAEADPMTRDEEGNWSVVCPDAKIGSGYKYRVTAGEFSADRIDPRAREVTNSVGNGIVYDDRFDWGDDDFELPAFNELVIYELHARTFVGDGKSDVSVLDRMIERLGYLSKLGVNAIELMPVAEFAGDLSWGYNPAHIFAVESSYGGPDALKRLVKEAHRQGIGVILDVVYNHFGPSDLDLWQFDGWSENGQGGIYFYNDWKADTPWGQTRPDYGRHEVRQFIRDNAMMWLDEFRMDGLRYDMTLFVRSVKGDGVDHLEDGLDLIRWINRDARSLPKTKILIAEDLQSEEFMTRSVEDGGAGFHAQWDEAFVHPVRGTLIVPEDGQRSMEAICGAVGFRYNDDAFQRIVYTESHDEVANGKARVPHEVDSENEDGFYAKTRSALGLALGLTSPGIPMLFQGQEFLEGGWFSDDDPLDWSKEESFAGMLELTKDLIRLRRNLNGTSAGLSGQWMDTLVCDEGQKIVAYHRWMEGGPGDSVVIVLNFNHEAQCKRRIAFPSEGRWQCLMNSAADRYTLNGDDSSSAQGDVEAARFEGSDDHRPQAEIDLAGYSFLIFGLDAK